MKKIIMTRGLPGSGKSTWSRAYQDENPDTVRVNKDDLRAMLYPDDRPRDRDRLVLAIRDLIVEQTLAQGNTVIVDDTNFSPKHEARLRELAKAHNALFAIQDFTGVPLEACIAHDLKRARSVGEQVIRRMHNRYLRPAPPTIAYDPTLRDCVICDLDGTLALFGDANPYERDFLADSANLVVLDLLLQLDSDSSGHKPPEVIFVSGRTETARPQTRAWLDWLGLAHWPQLHMRPAGDTRKDALVKREIYDEHICGKYNVRFVLDDRNQVVEMWRSVGLTVFQVAEGDF